MSSHGNKLTSSGIPDQTESDDPRSDIESNKERIKSLRRARLYRSGIPKKNPDMTKIKSQFSVSALSNSSAKTISIPEQIKDPTVIPKEPILSRTVVKSIITGVPKPKKDNKFTVDTQSSSPPKTVAIKTVSKVDKSNK